MKYIICIRYLTPEGTYHYEKIDSFNIYDDALGMLKVYEDNKHYKNLVILERVQ